MIMMRMAVAVAVVVVAAAAGGVWGQDAAQCETETFSLMRLYTAFQNTSANAYTMTELPDKSYIVYTPCEAVPYSTCLRGTEVGHVSSDGSSCTVAGSGTPKFLFNPRGFSCQWGGADGAVTTINFYCDSTAGLGAPVYTGPNNNGNPGWVLTWSSEFICVD